MTVLRPIRRVHHLTLRAALIACVGWGLTQPASADGQSQVAEEDVAAVTHLHVRSHSATIVRIIAQGSVQSETFRHVVNIINASNGIVYVEEGRCDFSVRACLVAVAPAGADHRILNVRVDTGKTDAELTGSIGHELYHATEVLSHPSVTTAAAMFSMYSRIGHFVHGIGFETDDAIKAGDAVYTEMRAAARKKGPLVELSISPPRTR